MKKDSLREKNTEGECLLREGPHRGQKLLHHIPKEKEAKGTPRDVPPSHVRRTKPIWTLPEKKKEGGKNILQVLFGNCLIPCNENRLKRMVWPKISTLPENRPWAWIRKKKKRAGFVCPLKENSKKKEKKRNLGKKEPGKPLFQELKKRGDNEGEKLKRRAGRQRRKGGSILKHCRRRRLTRIGRRGEKDLSGSPYSSL